MRALRRQSRTEEVDLTKVETKEEALADTLEVKNDMPTTPDVEKIRKEYETKIRNLQNMVSELKNNTISSFTKNEEKILMAIRSEKIKQNVPNPIISKTTLRSEYKISPKYQGDSIKSLIAKGIIEREEVIYSGIVKTFRWKIIEN